MDGRKDRHTGEWEVLKGWVDGAMYKRMNVMNG